MTAQEILTQMIVHGDFTDIGEPYSVQVRCCYIHDLLPHVVVASGARACLGCCLEIVAREYGGKVSITRQDMENLTLSTVNKSRSRYMYLSSQHSGPATTDRQSQALHLYEQIKAERGSARGVKSEVARRMGITLQAASALLKRVGK